MYDKVRIMRSAGNRKPSKWMITDSYSYHM